MSEPDARSSDVPHVRQSIRLPESTLESLRALAVGGTGRSDLDRVRDPDGHIAVVRNGWADGWFL